MICRRYCTVNGCWCLHRKRRSLLSKRLWVPRYPASRPAVKAQSTQTHIWSQRKVRALLPPPPFFLVPTTTKPLIIWSFQRVVELLNFVKWCPRLEKCSGFIALVVHPSRCPLLGYGMKLNRDAINLFLLTRHVCCRFKVVLRFVTPG